MLRNLRKEQDLNDQLFNSSEKRLARTLLLLARSGDGGKLPAIFDKINQDTLAEMVGTTRSRINFFMNKFRKLGFIHYNGGLEGSNPLAPEGPGYPRASKLRVPNHPPELAPSFFPSGARENARHHFTQRRR